MGRQLKACRGAAAPAPALSLGRQRHEWLSSAAGPNTKTKRSTGTPAAWLAPEMPDALAADNLCTSQHVIRGRGELEEGSGRGQGR